jgi:HlyD family secretion protein
MFNRKSLLTAVAAATVPVVVLLTTACGALPKRASLTNQSPRPAVAPTSQPSLSEPVAAAPETIQVQGTITTPIQATLTFKGGGRLMEVKVEEGALVKKGDTLAVLDATELQLAVEQAQAVLTGAQARLSQTKSPATSADTAAAQAAVDAALLNYEKVRAGPSANDLAPLKAQVDNAKAAIGQAQAAYDKIGGASNPYIGMAPQSLQLQIATNGYTAALAAYNNALTHPTTAELAAAWQQVQQAQDALSRLQPTSDNIANAQAQVDLAQVALALAQQHVADATLTAPIDGTVLTVGPHNGETVGPTTAILLLADLTHLQLQAGVDQSLLEQLQVGQTVTIVPDAFKDRTVDGKVSRIGWLATTTAGITNVPVTIDVDSSGVPLRPGLTATVEFNAK